jgi:hypothetical protein
MHALEVVDEGFFNLPFRFGAQAVDEFQQQIHQDVCEFPPTEQTEGCEEGEPERHGMPTEFIGFFNRHPLAIRVKHARGQVVDEVRGKVQGPEAVQLGEFLHEVV